MELGEKIVLQRREVLISCLVQFNQTFYNELLQQYLFTTAMVDAVWDKKGQLNRTKELRRCLLCRSNKKSFPKFCSVLRASGFSLLESYLTADLLLVKGELKFEEYTPVIARSVLQEVLKGKPEALVQKVSMLLAEECQLIRTAYLSEINRIETQINRCRSNFNESIYFIRLWLENILEITTSFGRQVNASKPNVADESNSENGKLSIRTIIKILHHKVLCLNEYRNDLQEQKERCLNIARRIYTEETDEQYYDLRIFLNQLNKNKYTEETDPERNEKITQLQEKKQQKSLKLEKLKAELLEKRSRRNVIVAKLEYYKKKCDQIQKVQRTVRFLKTEGAAVKAFTASSTDLSKNSDTYTGLSRFKSKIKFAKFMFNVLQEKCGTLCDKLTKPNCNQSCELHCSAKFSEIESSDEDVTSDDDAEDDDEKFDAC